MRLPQGLVLRIALALAAGFILLAGVIMGRGLLFRSRQLLVNSVDLDYPKPAGPAGRLARAVQFKTVSYQDHDKVDFTQFEALRQFLETSYPRVHASLKHEVVADHSLLYAWEGSQPALPPVLLLAHQDVVPVEPGTEADWTKPPFSGEMADGYIWGRGTLDDKSCLLAILEAVEGLLEKDFKPACTIYLAFGHDEEIGGKNGAAKTAEVLKSRGVANAAFVLDEGTSVTSGIVPGVKNDVALIGIAEKGYMTIELIAHGPGGHSSMPPSRTAVGRLSRAIASLEDHPVPGSLDGPVRQMFEYVGPELPFFERMVLANLWLFGGIVEHQLASKPSTDAALRTTTAATILDGGIKENVVPRQARGVVNFRIRPGDKSGDIVDHVRRVINDPEIEINVLRETLSEPSPVSRVRSEGYQKVEQTIRQLFPGTIVAPSLVLGATDSRHYSILSDNILRFAPVWVQNEDLARVHSTNERINIEHYARMIAFYEQLIRNAG